MKSQFLKLCIFYFLTDLTLAVVGGCAICMDTNNNNRPNFEPSVIPQVMVELVHTWPKGTLFTKCDEVNKTAG